MPDQPDDPIHYEMKIPPEPKDATLNKQDAQDEGESNKAEDDGPKKDDQSADRHQSPGR